MRRCRRCSEGICCCRLLLALFGTPESQNQPCHETTSATEECPGLRMPGFMLSQEYDVRPLMLLYLFAFAAALRAAKWQRSRSGCQKLRYVLLPMDHVMGVGQSAAVRSGISALGPFGQLYRVQELMYCSLGCMLLLVVPPSFY